MIYGVGLAFAHFAWLYAIKKLTSFVAPVSAYLTPALSTVWLALSGAHVRLPSVVAGLFGIMVGVYLVHHRDRPLAPLIATLLSFAMALALNIIVYPTPPASVPKHRKSRPFNSASYRCCSGCTRS